MRHALRRPDVRVVGIDVSAESLEHARALAARHEVANLELHAASLNDVFLAKTGRSLEGAANSGAPEEEPTGERELVPRGAEA